MKKSERKTGKYSSMENFSLLKIEDTSHALSRRLGIKLLCKKTVSNKEVRDAIPDFLERFRGSDYYRNEINRIMYENKLADSVWIYIYKTIEQFNRGRQSSTIVWNESGSKSPTKLTEFDETIDDNTQIRWIKDSLIEKDEMSKGKYLGIIDKFISMARDELQRIEQLSEVHRGGDIEIMKVEIVKGLDSFKSFFSKDYGCLYPPNECTDLDCSIRALNVLIENIYIVSQDKHRNRTNIIQCVTLYLKQSNRALAGVGHERKKVI